MSVVAWLPMGVVGYMGVTIDVISLLGCCFIAMISLVHYHGCGLFVVGVVRLPWVYSLVTINVVLLLWAWFCCYRCGFVTMGVGLLLWVFFATMGVGFVTLGVFLLLSVCFCYYGCGFCYSGCGFCYSGCFLLLWVWFCCYGCFFGYYGCGFTTGIGCVVMTRITCLW